MKDIMNCKKCHRVFKKFHGDLCTDCLEEEHSTIDNLRHYLWLNPLTELEEILQRFDLSKNHIYELIKNRHLILDQKSPLGYPCSRCRIFIKEDNLCSVCFAKLQKDISHMEELDKTKKKKGKRYFLF